MINLTARDKEAPSLLQSVTNSLLPLCVATCWPPLCLNILDNHFVTLPIFEGHVSALSWQCRTVLLHIFCSFSPLLATDWSARSEQNPESENTRSMFRGWQNINTNPMIIISQSLCSCAQ